MAMTYLSLQPSLWCAIFWNNSVISVCSNIGKVILHPLEYFLLLIFVSMGKWQWRFSCHYGVQYSETMCTAILRTWFVIILNSFEYLKVFWNVLKQLCHIGLCSNIGKVISNPGSPEILLSVKMWHLQKRLKDCNCVLKHCFFQVLETLHCCGKNSALISVYITCLCAGGWIAMVGQPMSVIVWSNNILDIQRKTVVSILSVKRW